MKHNWEKHIFLNMVREGHGKSENSKLFSTVIRESQGMFFLAHAIFKLLLVTLLLLICTNVSLLIKHVYGYIQYNFLE